MQTAKGAGTRQSVLNASLRLFAKDGFHKTTMRAIAAESGHSLGNAYYYFGSKEELAGELYRSLRQEHRARAWPKLTAGNNLETHIRTVLDTVLDVLEPFHDFGPAFIRAGLTGTENPQDPDRGRDLALWRQAVESARPQPPLSVRQDLPELLWLLERGVVLFWAHALPRPPAQPPPDHQRGPRRRIAWWCCLRLPVVRTIFDDRSGWSAPTAAPAGRAAGLRACAARGPPRADEVHSLRERNRAGGPQAHPARAPRLKWGMTSPENASRPAITLTIAGSEATGGAGAQADLKTFQELGVYGITALTCIVSFDPKDNWNHRFVPVEAQVIADQLEAVQTCYPGSLDTVKLGMMGSPATIDTVAAALKGQQWRNIVLDPVLICKGQEPGHALDTDQALKASLLPLATFVTPNHFEAESLSGIAIKDVEDLKEAARLIHEASGAAVLAKGGVRLAGLRRRGRVLRRHHPGGALRARRSARSPCPAPAARWPPPSPPNWPRAHPAGCRPHRQGVRHRRHQEPRLLQRPLRRPVAGRRPLNARHVRSPTRRRRRRRSSRRRRRPSQTFPVQLYASSSATRSPERCLKAKAVQPGLNEGSTGRRSPDSQKVSLLSYGHCMRTKFVFFAALLVPLLAGCGLKIPTDPEGTLDRVSGGTLRAGISHNPPWTETGTGTRPDQHGPRTRRHRHHSCRDRDRPGRHRGGTRPRLCRRAQRPGRVGLRRRIQPRQAAGARRTGSRRRRPDEGLAVVQARRLDAAVPGDQQRPGRQGTARHGGAAWARTRSCSSSSVSC